MTRPVSRRLLALLLAPLLVVVTGCGRVTAEFEIRSENDVSIRLNVAVEKDVAARGRIDTSTMCDAIRPGQHGYPLGTVVEPYQDNRFVGCKVTLNGTVRQIGADVIEHKDGRWYFHFKPDSRQIAALPPQVQAGELSEFRVAVTFPGKVRTHNGSSTVSGRTVTWNDPADFVTGDGLQASSDDPPNWILMGGILAGIVLVGLIVVVVLLLATHGRRREERVQRFVDEGYAQQQRTRGEGEHIASYYADPAGFPSGYTAPPPAADAGWQPAHPDPAAESTLPWDVPDPGQPTSWRPPARPAGPDTRPTAE